VDQSDASPPHTLLFVSSNNHPFSQFDLMHRPWNNPQKTNPLIHKKLTRKTVPL
jgi:hypothetical protein